MDEITVRRAELIELQDDLSDIMPGGKRVPVQFNPETLKVSYANQVQSQPNASSSGAAPQRSGRGAANQSQGSATRQFVGQGTTKLSLQLWFDVSAATDAPFMVDDVRRLTAAVLYFMKPKDPQGGGNSASQRVPPGVRFSWGSFLFDGIVESVEESIEFFSPDGKPLRASMALGLVQQNIVVPAFTGNGAVNRVPGTQAMGSAQTGQPLQQMSGTGSGGGSGGGSFGEGLSGNARNWQKVAVVNGIENPRFLEPGQLINLNAQRPRIVTE